MGLYGLYSELADMLLAHLDSDGKLALLEMVLDQIDGDAKEDVANIVRLYGKTHDCSKYLSDCM